MPPSPQCSAWQRVLDYTERMLACARAEDWTALAALMEERDRAFPPPIREIADLSEGDLLIALLRKLRTANAEITARAGTRRDASAAELRHLRRGRTVHRAYSGTPPPGG